jgi:hypothetical protein
VSDVSCFIPGISPLGPTVTGNVCFPPNVLGTFNFEIPTLTYGGVQVWIFPDTLDNVGVNGTDEFLFLEKNGDEPLFETGGTLTISGDIGGIEYTPEPPSLLLLGTGLFLLLCVILRHGRINKARVDLAGRVPRP